MAAVCTRVLANEKRALSLGQVTNQKRVLPAETGTAGRVSGPFLPKDFHFKLCQVSTIIECHLVPCSNINSYVKCQVPIGIVFLETVVCIL